jgi:hypothetical protein
MRTCRWETVKAISLAGHAARGKMTDMHINSQSYTSYNQGKGSERT